MAEDWNFPGTAPRPDVCSWCHLFVRVMDVYRRLMFLIPNALVERLQTGSLQQGQGSSHLPATLPQNLMTASLITETQHT